MIRQLGLDMIYDVININNIGKNHFIAKAPANQAEEFIEFFIQKSYVHQTNNQTLLEYWNKILNDILLRMKITLHE